VLAVFSVARADPQLPIRTGAVVDAADIIRPNQEQALAAKAESLKSQSNVELVVVTLPSLQGYSIERWGRDLGNGWRVGGSGARGALLIVAPNDREMRIEVGDGLASTLSDRQASSIIDNIIVPQFRSGEMSGGILAGVDAIAKALTGARATSVTKQPSTPTYEPAYRSETDWSGLKTVLVVGVMILLSVFGAARGTTRDDNDSSYLGGRSSSRSSWSSSRSSFSSGRSSRSFSGRGASGRW
jgi:uncharacterized protein